MDPDLKHFFRDAHSHHDGENDGSHGGLEDPEDGQTGDLYQREEMNTTQRDVTQEREIRLVFGWHQVKLYSFPKLNKTQSGEFLIIPKGTFEICH